MVRWFWQRRRPPGRTLRLRSRDEASDVRRVDFEQLAPDLATYLGQAAYLQLGYVETLSSLIERSPELGHKESLSRAAGAALFKHQALVALIRDRGDDPLDLMLPFREPLGAFRRATMAGVARLVQLRRGWDRPAAWKRRCRLRAARSPRRCHRRRTPLA